MNIVAEDLYNSSFATAQYLMIVIWMLCFMSLHSHCILYSMTFQTW